MSNLSNCTLDWIFLKQIKHIFFSICCTEDREMAERSEEKSKDLARGCDFLLPEPNPTIPPPLLSYASHIF